MSNGRSFRRSIEGTTEAPPPALRLVLTAQLYATDAAGETVGCEVPMRLYSELEPDWDRIDAELEDGSPEGFAELMQIHAYQLLEKIVTDPAAVNAFIKGNQVGAELKAGLAGVIAGAIGMTE